MALEGPGTTLAQHIRLSERLHPEATGEFSMLLHEIVVAAKVISREVNRAGILEEILGLTGETNVQGEEVQKLDEYANDTLVRVLGASGKVAIMGSEDGEFGYTLQVYTRKDSGIDELKDLKGKRVAHTSPTSNSGNQAPRALFPKQGIVPGEDYEVVYSGSHDQSMLGVVAGDYDAAPVASEVVDRMAERGLYDPKEVKIIFESKRFPTTSYTYAHNLKPELAEKIKQAFMDFDFQGTALGEEFSGVTRFVPITYKEDWEVIRDIQEANGVTYTPENLDKS